MKTARPPDYLSYWMSKISDQTLLRNLIIPGSHNTNSHDLYKPKLNIPFTQCQVLSISDQLKLGIRYLDIRYGANTSRKSKKFGVDR